MDERNELGNDLLRAVARLNRWASRNAGLDVPMAQARLLGVLEELGPARVSVLAAADNCSQPTMTAQVQRLEAEGWAHRVPDPDDARAALVSLTSKGSAALRRVREARVAVLSTALESLDEAGVERLRTAVLVLDRLLDQATVATTPPTRKES